MVSSSRQLIEEFLVEATVNIREMARDEMSSPITLYSIDLVGR